MNNQLKGTLLALFTILVWGTTFISTKYLLNAGFDAFQIMLTRFIIAYIVLCIIQRKKVGFERLKEEGSFFLLSLFGTTLYFMTENLALSYSTASNVSILVASAPMFTAVLAHMFLKEEKIRKGTVLGFCIAIIGVAMVVFNGTVVLNLNPIGDALAIASALCWGIYGVMLQPKLLKYDSMTITRKILFYGIFTSILLVLIRGKGYPFHTWNNMGVAGNYLFLGVLGSGICYVTWNMANEYIGAIRTANFIYLNPFTTMIAAAFFLEEKITYMGFIGAVMIIFGIIISSSKKFSANE